ncbi:CD59B glycoprotein-like [Tachyglossus aculeatus]|uniref:CD59B glycoprotein-like n=1 Tax=Tachyglossus aculeatus TaxID=9261 RepID=UPI0018F2F231|nr:CD59B glycoprotein-like [Tachyglossus aculeatus]
MLSRHTSDSAPGMLLSLMVAAFFSPAQGLQCYGCNIVIGTKSIDAGCSNPEIITCSHSHKGFKHRFCIKTESVVLRILLTSGCATSRHCLQQELPGVRIHCCEDDLCNGSPRAPSRPRLLPCASALLPWLLATCFLL